MARATSTQYTGREVTVALEEGAWTDDDDYKIGGSFATPLTKGDYVEIGTANMRVKAVATAANAIGKLKSTPQGEHVENSRHATVEFFGDQVMEVTLHTDSKGVTLGASVQPTTSNLWMSDSAANDTFALTSASSGSGGTIAVLMGRWSF